jgi:Holliday junction resolvase-like predicted endonuclease
MSQEIGKRNEEEVADDLRRQGYQVLNAHEYGFPDLIVLEGTTIKFFVEVKGGRHKVHQHQEDAHRKLEKMGFQVRTIRKPSKRQRQ